MSIPCSYRAYVAPIFAPRLYEDCAATQDNARFEKPYVVKMKQVHLLGGPANIWEFSHGQTAPVARKCFENRWNANPNPNHMANLQTPFLRAKSTSITNAEPQSNLISITKRSWWVMIRSRPALDQFSHVLVMPARNSRVF